MYSDEKGHQRIIDLVDQSGHNMTKYLHHYALADYDLNPLKFDGSSYRIQLKRTKNLKDKVLFCTTQSFADSDLANKTLSLTYYPRYDAIIETSKIQGCSIIGNMGKVISPENLWGATRVWPAFGLSLIHI